LLNKDQIINLRNEFKIGNNYSPIYLTVENFLNFKSMLRSLEVFYLFGFNDFTCPVTWFNIMKKFGFANIYPNFHHFDSLKKNPINKLLCFTRQNEENKKEIQYSINNIYHLYSNFNTNRLLMLIVDTPSFKIYTHNRELIDQESIRGNSVFRYSDLYNSIKSIFHKHNFKFTLNNSMNLYFQEIAIFHNFISEIRVNNVVDLFRNIFNNPFSPIWDFLSKLLLTGRNLIKKISLSGSEENISFKRLLDLFGLRINKSELNELFVILKSELTLASKSNFHLKNKRFNKITNPQKQKIEEFKLIINQINYDYSFLFRRLKSFCDYSSWR